MPSMKEKLLSDLLEKMHMMPESMEAAEGSDEEEATESEDEEDFEDKDMKGLEHGDESNSKPKGKELLKMIAAASKKGK